MGELNSRQGKRIMAGKAEREKRQFKKMIVSMWDQTIRKMDWQLEWIWVIFLPVGKIS